MVRPPRRGMEVGGAMYWNTRDPALRPFTTCPNRIDRVPRDLLTDGNDWMGRRGKRDRGERGREGERERG